MMCGVLSTPCSLTQYSGVSLHYRRNFAAAGEEASRPRPIRTQMQGSKL